MTEQIDDSVLAAADFERLVHLAQEREKRAQKRAIMLTAIPLIVGLIWLAISFNQVNVAARQAAVLEAQAARKRSELKTLEAQRAEALVALKTTNAQLIAEAQLLKERSEQFARQKCVPLSFLTQTQQSVANASAAVTRTTESVVPSIGILIATEKQRSVAVSIRRALEARGFSVPAIRSLGAHGVAPELTEVRYFHGPSDRAQALQLRDLLQGEFGFRRVRPAFTVDQDTPPKPPNSFEIWFSPSAEDAAEGN